MLKSFVLFMATCLLLPHCLAQPVTGRRRGSDDFLEFDDHRFRDYDFFPDRSGIDDSHRIPFPMMQAIFEDNPFMLGRQFGPPPPPPFFPGPPPPPPAFIPGPPPPPAFIPGPPPPPFFPGPPPVFVGGPPPPFVPGPPPPFFPGPAPVFLWGPPPPWFSFPPHMYRELMPKHRHDCKFNSKAGPTPHKEETPYNGKKEAEYDQPRPLPVKYNAEQNRPYVPPTPVYVNSIYEYPKEERLQEVSNAYQPDPSSHVNEARPPYERQRYPVNDFPYEKKS